jgi:cyclophilin family peptidyl-prolyl cis-trans isomerase
MFMQSNGGLTDAAQFHGKDAILSGPAGGVVGMARSQDPNSANSQFFIMLDEASYLEAALNWRAPPPKLLGEITGGPNAHDVAVSILRQCLCPEASKRPTAKDVNLALRGKFEGLVPESVPPVGGSPTPPVSPTPPTPIKGMALLSAPLNSLSKRVDFSKTGRPDRPPCSPLSLACR